MKRIDSGICQKRIDMKGDRLSSLPDDIIHKILNSFDMKHVIETSVLSSRWRHIWASMPYLNFSSKGFTVLSKFSTFVIQVLTHRNNDANVSSVKLSAHGKISLTFFKRFLKYAFSHNVEKMTIKFGRWSRTDFPICLFNSQSLKHLTLIKFTIHHSITPSSTWVLPALTTLHLDNVTLSDHATDKISGLFSNCTNLKELILNGCHKELMFSFGSFPHLDKVDLCTGGPVKLDAPKYVCLLQQFHSVKFLNLNLEFLEALSSSVELISNQPCPFSNLESLRIYPKEMHESSGQAPKQVNVSDVVKSYLLASSPSATVTIVSHEEMRALRNATLAQEQMEKLWVLLGQKKSKTAWARWKAQVENKGEQASMKMPPPLGKKTAQIQRFWEDLSLQLRRERAGVDRILSKLHDIEKLLTELPASKRVNMESCFSRLFAEAMSVMNEVTFGMKIHCDANQSRSSDYFDQVGKALQPSS